jgi:hypothetical protein
MTTTLFERIRLSYSNSNSNVSDVDLTHLLYLVYTLCKVRGYKTVSRLFPHAVEDLEPTFKLLEKYTGQGARQPAAQVDDQQEIHPLILQAQQFALDEIEWRVPYVLLLWLSVISLIPFDLNALDNAQSGMPLKDRLLETAKHYLQESSITRNAASELLSTLLTRPDMKSELGKFLKESVSTVTRLSNGPSSELLITNNQYLVSGLYMTLSLIFQKGERERLVSHVGPILQAFFPANAAPSSSSRDAQQKEEENDEDSPQYELPSNAMINKKLSVKLVQRLALVLLAPRNPKWRYQRRSVSLLSNLQKSLNKDNGNISSSATATSSKATTSTDNEADEDEEDEDYEIPEELEIFIQLLFSALRDKDTIVRWSAAKGIGRLTHRLSQGLADEIVASLMELFDSRETDSAWHGACLAVAELARRGLLLPSRLTDLIKKLKSALQFEIRRGSHSTGHHVRDAACYVAWALARAYDPGLLRDHLAVSLSSSLLLTALFDKEVNCRRAAAAAFQEHVGRQGSFPYGIEIISIVNFFTLSNRSEAYLNISTQVASHPEYSNDIIDHLAFSKCQHVDHTIRELAARTLGKLCFSNPRHLSYIASDIIPKLIPLTTKADFATRQGAIQAVAEIVSSFASVLDVKGSSSSSLHSPSSPSSSTSSSTIGDDRQSAISEILSKELQAQIWNIPHEIEKARLYRGRGSEYVRIAVSRLISAISRLGLSLQTPPPASDKPSAGRGKMPPSLAQRLAAGPVATKTGKDPLTFFIETIEENLRHPHEDVVDSAVQATRSLALRYLPSSSSMASQLIDRWMKTISTDTNQAARRGHCLGIGALPLETIGSRLPDILETLSSATKILGKKNQMDDADVRKNAITGLLDIVDRVRFIKEEEPGRVDPSALSRSQLSSVLEVYMVCMEDYTTDTRGDIGSQVREAAISAMGSAIVKMRSEDERIQYEIDRLPSQSVSPSLSSTAKSSASDPFLTCELIVGFTCKLVRLALEKIDRTRERAGVMLEQMLRSILGLSSTASSYKFWSQVSMAGIHLPNYIPHAQELWEAIERASKSIDAKSVITNSLNWTSSRVVFPILVPLLRFDEYRYCVNLGIIRSVGGANNSKELVDDATSSLLTSIRSIQGTSLLDVYASTVLSIMRNNPGNEQIITSLWVTLDLIFASGLLSSLVPPSSSFATEFLALCRSELRLPSSITKLSASVPIFGHLLTFEIPEVREGALKMIVFFLGYKYPVIRKLAAESLYLQLDSYPQILNPKTPDYETSLERAKEILSSVSWAWNDEFMSGKDSLSIIFGLKSATAK